MYVVCMSFTPQVVFSALDVLGGHVRDAWAAAAEAASQPGAISSNENGVRVASSQQTLLAGSSRRAP